MSIILKGIDLPKEGEHIVTLIKSNGKCTYWKQDTEYGICEPMQTVEAIQIPKRHGDIKDINTVEDELDERCGQLSAEIVRNAPTILESEVMPK